MKTIIKAIATAFFRVVADAIRNALEKRAAKQWGHDEAELEARRKADAARAAIDASRGRMPAPSDDPYNRDN